MASGFHLPEINTFYGINCEPNEVGLSLLLQESCNLPAYFTRVFSPRCVHDKKDSGNEVVLKLANIFDLDFNHNPIPKPI